MLKQLLTVVFLLSAGTLWAQQAAGLLPVQEDTHCKEWVEQTLSRMKLKDKVGQLFVYTLAPRADKDTEKLVGKLTRKFKVGAFLYSEGNSRRSGKPDQLCATPVENSINDYL